MVAEGYSEEEAYKIGKRDLKIQLQMEFEKKKRVLTGQLITDQHLFEKQQELEKDAEKE